MITLNRLEEIKHYSVRVSSLSRILRNLKDKKYDLRGISYSTEKVTSSKKNEGNLTVDKCIDLEIQLKEAIECLNKEKALAIDKILKIPNIYGDVLLLRYVEQLDWRSIADELDKSESYLKSIHKQAMDMYNELGEDTPS